MHNHSAGALQQRLDDYRHNFVMPLFEQTRQRTNAINVAGCTPLSERATKTMRRGNTPHRKSKSLKRSDEIGLRSNRHGSDGVPMVSVFQAHEFIFALLALIAPKLQSHLQRHFYCGRADIGKKDVLERLRQDAPQALGEFLGRVVRKSGKDHVLEFPRLFRNGLGDQRMCVPVKIDPPGGDCVDQLASVACIEIDALAPFDVDRLRVKRFLRKRVPDGERFSRHLSKIITIEAAAKYVQQSFTINGIDPRYRSDDWNSGEMLDGALVIFVAMADHHYALYGHFCTAESPDREESMIDGAERGSRGNQNGKSEAPRQIEHQLRIVDGNENAPGAFGDDRPDEIRGSLNSREVDPDAARFSRQVWRYRRVVAIRLRRVLIGRK